MDVEYDVIVLGTGLTECILSGLLSVDGKKVLHMDRNDYYGAESASLNLTQFYSKFRPGESVPDHLGRDRDWNIDLIPKFMMANGEIVRFLTHTDVTRYLEFKQIAGSYVYSGKKVSKVPANASEALSSPLMGILEKRRMRSFMLWVEAYKDEDPKTHQNIDINTMTMTDVYNKFGLAKGTQEFIGHAMALHLDDTYLTNPARDTVERVRLYAASVLRYGKSPYIYPLYGLGDLPQAFARLSAVYGGTYMLDKDVKELVYNENGQVVGVKAGDEVVHAKMVICDPSYAPSKVRKVGSVVRAICLLTHPIPNTNDSDSCQIVIPQNQIGRKHDIYVACVSDAHMVCPKGYYLAIVSTIVETNNPAEEINEGLKLLGPIQDKFVHVSPLEEPIEDGTKDNVYISRSYDATSHFETVCDDVHDIWRRITGGPLVLKKREADDVNAA
ncbi:rab GTPase activator [Rhizopus microsporus ATCC 52813]|uniref:Rab GDP dissociation inhibitor n=2 Tax=Rhizopus microsporus TaxID=58291 RepID=A0A2G4SR25_RHIZD|nr:rab GTPase activator [Rhizopus microsporus ATCC 52813]PHZ11205.1 rab GTPase activator [Rhizopus microsporus ATCC 52813]